MDFLAPFRTARALVETAQDVARGASRAPFRDAWLAELSALPAVATGTAPWFVRTLLGGTLESAARRNARRDPNGTAFLHDDTCWTWSDLDRRTSDVAWMLERAGVARGDVIALLGPNAPDYFGWVLGATRAGATAALVNTHLEGRPLHHAITSAKARVVVVHASLVEPLRALRRDGHDLPPVHVYGDALQRVDRASDEHDATDALARTPSTPYPPAPTTDEGDFVYIYTSGTTGLPKPCRISHARAVLAGAGFGYAVFAFQPGDVLYSVLPLYHASALMLGGGACLTTGTPMALRDGFSARAFWPDVHRYGATAMLYIGELCRYLLASPEHPLERPNPLRIAGGNGLRPDVWPAFQERFGIPMIREFYAATEAPGFIVNLTGRVGSVGHVPLRRTGWMTLVRYDVERGEHLRDERGFFVPCERGEVGELLVRLPERPLTPATEFRGYTDESASQKKVLTDVFLKGDRYFRSGDLLRFDEDDFFYFVDRIGDTYRWKGENVSTAEVADVLTSASSIAEATVVGVRVPGNEGQAGLAAVVLEPGSAFDADAFWKTAQELPSYAQPRFVRVLSSLATTGTFKIQKNGLRNEGVDPSQVTDPLFVRSDAGYLPLDATTWGDVTEGRFRL
ncbi:MAG: long-chain-acyl-CoA synthetase [Sandaracinus sp.]|nr:long-chain-acyl-CoA synthetase [Sandaracinus sp.]